MNWKGIGWEGQGLLEESRYSMVRIWCRAMITVWKELTEERVVEEGSLEGLRMCQRRRRKSLEWYHGFWHTCLDVMTCGYKDRQSRARKKKMSSVWDMLKVRECETSTIHGLANGGYMRLLLWDFSWWPSSSWSGNLWQLFLATCPRKNWPRKSKQKHIPRALGIYPS